jgi:FkbM family methyltransferase
MAFSLAIRKLVGRVSRFSITLSNFPGVRAMNPLRKLLRTESEWNPKVILGRTVTSLLPESALHTLKKHYYGYLLTHVPEEWMESDASLLPYLVRSGDRVVDVGANLGMYSRRLAKLVGPHGAVYAFEPIPQTFDFLNYNLQKLGLRQVERHCFALSDSERSDVMVIPKYRWGSECWYDARVKTAAAQADWRQIEVHSRTLDSFDLPPVSFVKCDANYHELQVLRGALATIKRDHPALLIEVNPDPDDSTTTAFETFGLLRDLGYGAYCWKQERLEPRRVGQRSQNYFFLTESQARHVLIDSETAQSAGTLRTTSVNS